MSSRWWIFAASLWMFTRRRSIRGPAPAEIPHVIRQRSHVGADRTQMFEDLVPGFGVHRIACLFTVYRNYRARRRRGSSPTSRPAETLLLRLGREGGLFRSTTSSGPRHNLRPVHPQASREASASALDE